MALINCPECGKEISDKAASCPHCGNPINQQTEEDKGKEYILCPQCHSKELHTHQAGFSGGKALVGTALTGGIGLLAGTLGSKNIQITCLKCNNTFKVKEAVILSDEKEAEINKEMEQIFVTDGNREAVKYYGKQTGSDFHNSVQYVDQYRKKNKLVAPSAGCASVILLFILVSSTLYMFY